MSRLIFLLIVFSTEIVAAQEVATLSRYTPLEIGNRWEYVFTYQHWPWNWVDMTEGEINDPQLIGSLTTEVVRDTLLNDERHVVLLKQQFDSAGTIQPEYTYSCAVRVLESGDVVFPDEEGVPGLCERWDVLDNILSIPLNGAHKLNTDSLFVPVEALGILKLNFPHTAWTVSSSFHGRFVLMEYAADIGLYRWSSWVPPRNMNGYIYSYQLSYAEIDERVYAVATVPDFSPPHTSLMLQSPFPNPASHRIQISVNHDVAEEASVEIFGSTGKLFSKKRIQLNPGTTMITEDVVNFPAGVYFIRVLSSKGHVDTQTFIKL